MPTLKKLTVRYLRELARKHLGKGHSRLKTKDELVAALRKVVPGLGGEAPVEGKAEKKSAARPRKAVKAQPEAPARRAAPAASPERVTVVHFPKPAPRKPESPAEAAFQPHVGAPPPWAPPPPYAPPEAVPAEVRPQFAAAEPLVEGFFVAKVAGEQEARVHHLTEDQVPAPVHTRSPLHFDERLAEIPWEYPDDRVVMMARDPHTLYLYWEFRRTTLEAAFHGLDSPRVLLHLYESGRVVRTVDVSLESRSYYVPGLLAGRTYRAELHVVGREGSWRRLGPSAGEVTLPADDISPDTTVRFMRVPWGVPLNKMKDALRSGRVRVETPAVPPQALEFTHYRWVPLPNSGSWQLVSWTERLFGEVVAGGPSLQGLPMGAFPVGGSSSWTLQGGSQVTASWQVAGSWQMSGASSRLAPPPPQPSPEAPPQPAPAAAPQTNLAFPPHPERKG